MNDPIKVHVVRYGDCSNLILRYRDPLTGRQVRKSSGTASKKDARKAAARWEDELNSGKARGRFVLTWEQFRLRYEDEVLPGLAPKTAQKVGGIFNVLESILPKVKAGLLRELTAERISFLQADLRRRGRAEATIAGHLGHLRAALNWAVDQGLLAAMPEIRRPKRAKRSGRADPMKGRPITTEEFERMLDKITQGLTPDPARRSATASKQGRKGKRKAPKTRPPTIPSVEVMQSWRQLLLGLWWSGLRLGEALNLYWDRSDKLRVDLPADGPCWHFRRVGEGRARSAPAHRPGICRLPAGDPRGRAPRAGLQAPFDRRAVRSRLLPHLTDDLPHRPAGRGQSGDRSRHGQGEARLRTRPPPVVWGTVVDAGDAPGLNGLDEARNHRDHERYYVGRNANATADAVWDAYEKAGLGTVLGTVGQKEATDEAVDTGVNPCESSR